MNLTKGMAHVIKDAFYIVNKNNIQIGKALKIMKDSGGHKDQNYDTFNQWVSSLGVMPRSARRYIAIVEKYIDELKIEEERLYGITPARLEKMIPFIGECNIKKRDEWLARATTCSNKDFIDLVNEELGHSSGIIEKRIWGGTEASARGGGTLGRKNSPSYCGRRETSPRLSPPEYMKMVKTADCVLCPGKKNYGRGHHFPITVGAGAKKWWVIPLCEICHVEAHHDPKEFLWKYKGKLMGWIYNRIVKEE